jgi:hypothetical protein
VEELRSRAFEDRVFDPWLVMNNERMAAFLYDKERVRKAISAGIESNEKSIKNCCDKMNKNIREVTYHSPSVIVA